ncbi:TPA: hypothetical protein N0F65_002906 [Lagenidium giganteum]|uniref:RING-type domain-containing protein n=1 Tax=Lagenidium giganteum TaxID=4803 RepID=A0AAV2ZB15_9STRA|nr:TPA: hypothetical protein N0F65_002906 [Lagenidium giganteum]
MTLRGCGHRFCLSCLMASLRDRIDAGERHLQCGYEHATVALPRCDHEIANEDVSLLVTAETWVQYNEESQTRKRQLGRATALVLRRFREGTHQETIFCQMCFEHVPRSDAIVFKLRGCNHEYCRACLEHYLTAKIAQHIARPICFHAKQGKDSKQILCGNPITREDIQLLVSSEEWKRHKTNEKRRSPTDTTYECPNCGRWQACRKARKQPQVKCISCKKAFCVLHNISHDGATCAEYERGLKLQSKLDHARISKLATPCPECNGPVEKTRAQNNMSCLSCQHHFCWLCHAKLNEDDANHFAWWNITGCPTGVLTPPDPAMPNGSSGGKARRFAIKYVVGLPFYLIGFVLALPTWLLRLCCWGSNRVGFGKHVDDCALSVLFLLAMIPLAVLIVIAIVLDALTDSIFGLLLIFS